MLPVLGRLSGFIERIALLSNRPYRSRRLLFQRAASSPEIISESKMQIASFLIFCQQSRRLLFQHASPCPDSLLNLERLSTCQHASFLRSTQGSTGEKIDEGDAVLLEVFSSGYHGAISMGDVPPADSPPCAELVGPREAFEYTTASVTDNAATIATCGKVLIQPLILRCAAQKQCGGTSRGRSTINHSPFSISPCPLTLTLSLLPLLHVEKTTYQKQREIPKIPSGLGVQLHWCTGMLGREELRSHHAATGLDCALNVMFSACLKCVHPS